MRLGIGSYTYPWAIGVPGHEPVKPLTVFDLLERAVALGVRVVQFCDNLPLAALSSDELDGLEQQAEDRKLALEIGTRGLEPANLRRCLELAQRFRTSFVRLVIDSVGDEPSPEDAVTRLKTLEGDFRTAGVHLAIENHDRFTASTLARIVETLGTDWTGICLDTVNSMGALENPKAVVETLAQYTLNLHLKDFTLRRTPSQMGFIVEGCPVGEGRLDVPWLLRTLSRMEDHLSVIVELWTPPSGSITDTIERERSWAEKSVRNLRSWILE